MLPQAAEDSGAGAVVTRTPPPPASAGAFVPFCDGTQSPSGHKGVRGLGFPADAWPAFGQRSNEGSGRTSCRGRAGGQQGALRAVPEPPPAARSGPAQLCAYGHTRTHPHSSGAPRARVHPLGVRAPSLGTEALTPGPDARQPGPRPRALQGPSGRSAETRPARLPSRPARAQARSPRRPCRTRTLRGKGPGPPVGGARPAPAPRLPCRALLRGRRHGGAREGDGKVSSGGSRHVSTSPPRVPSAHPHVHNPPAGECRPVWPAPSSAAAQ
ncbi:PREDICTED: translation initiation factor IF-2-like [Chinchilla lanigera]|uniref:translation initiation factor IF-2-like n=1 Tax=Chinchilla lanigera TaxID=34839 RepID=UPI0006989BE1|nr:PREDICTED: translation initiation factor IF-2-like [Chinchilla lanigera]